jgi:hypothetical protein
VEPFEARAGRAIQLCVDKLLELAELPDSAEAALDTLDCLATLGFPTTHSSALRAEALGREAQRELFPDGG